MNLACLIPSVRRWLTCLVVILAIAGCLAASVAAVAPDWHAWLHAGAGEHDEEHGHDDSPHQCAATMLAQGLMECLDGAFPWTAFAGHELRQRPPGAARLAATFLDRFPPGRAPPGSPHVHDPRHSS